MKSWEAMSAANKMLLIIEIVARSGLVIFILLPLFIYFFGDQGLYAISALFLVLGIQVWVPSSLFGWKFFAWSTLSILANTILILTLLYLSGWGI